MSLRRVVLHKHFKEEFANFLVSHFKGMGLGNSTLSSDPDDNPIIGDKYVFKSAWVGKKILNWTVRATWQCEWISGDVWNNTIAEIAVVRNASDGRFDGFVRLVIDPISINASDIYRFYVSVEI